MEEITGWASWAQEGIVKFSESIVKNPDDIAFRLYQSGVDPTKAKEVTSNLQGLYAKIGITPETVGKVSKGVMVLDFALEIDKKLGISGGMWQEITKLLSRVAAWDPNDKEGPASQWILPEQTLHYTIFFENAIPTATTYARRIEITDQLDSNLDLATLVFDDVCIGGKVIDIPEDSIISTSTIFSPGTWTGPAPETDTCKLCIYASSTPTGLTRFILEARDINGSLTDLLPPNSYSPNGEGWVSFSIKPKSDLSSETQIKNKAGIIFDINPPIDTKEVLNTVDASFPASSIASLPLTQTRTTFSVNYSGSDAHSGVKNLVVYISDNGASYAPIFTKTFDSPLSTFSGSFTYQGKYGHSYKFYSRSMDAVGNFEAEPLSPDAEISIILEGLRINTDKRALGISATTTLYSLNQEGTEYVEGTWSIEGNIGTLSNSFGTSTIFYASSIGFGTISVISQAKGSWTSIIVGRLVDKVNTLTATLSVFWGTATIRIGTEANTLVFIPPKAASVDKLSKLKGNVGIGVVLNAYDTLGNKLSGTLTNPIYIEIQYKKELLGNIDENTLLFYILSDEGDVGGTISCSLSTITKTISGTFNHLSIIALAGTSQQALTAENLKNISVYPNPFVPYDNDKDNGIPYNGSADSGITFKGLTENAEIRIFNLAGRLVREVMLTNQGIWQWDARNQNNKELSSGIYIYVITNNKKEKATGRIAIVK
ncbi:MAG: T9SS type A sorting domain-containing protein [bacterium]